jgi:hypothetical protein
MRLNQNQELKGCLKMSDRSGGFQATEKVTGL